MGATRCRVAVDGAVLGDGDSARRGIGTVARQLLDALAAVEGVEVAVVAPARRRPWRPPARALAAGVRAAGADVFLGLASAPPGRPVGVPVVQVLYDVIPLVDPDPRFADARRWWEARRRHWQAVDRVVAISRWSATTAVEHLGLDPAAVDVVHLAPAPSFTPDGPAVDRPRPYLVVASTWGPHKGIETAMEALDLLVDGGHDVDLVVAGDQLPHGRAQLVAARAGRRHPGRIELAGWVPDLAALYRGAACVLVPSRAEGFGLPAVEAMACGVPVVASRGTGLEEAAGDGAALVAPGDAPALAAAVAPVLDDPSVRADLVARGEARVAALSWGAVAGAYAAVLRAAAATPSSAAT